MPERTPNEIQTIFDHANDFYVTELMSNAYYPDQFENYKEQIKYYVLKLEEVKALKKEDNTTSIWTDEDFHRIDTAITFGKTFDD